MVVYNAPKVHVLYIPFWFQEILSPQKRSFQGKIDDVMTLNGNYPRSHFIQQLQLAVDPFLTPVAEQELIRLKSLFLDFFVPIPSSQGPLSPETLLQRDSIDLIFGAPGSGKTTLRLALEAQSRSVITPTITIAYIFGERSPQLTKEEHLQLLLQSIAVDLVIHLIERFDPLDPPNEQQIKALRTQVQTGGALLQRVLQAIVEGIESQSLDPDWGIAHYWERLGKVPVRYVEGSKALGEFLAQLISEPSERVPIGMEGIEAALRTARLWGVVKMVILVDAVDTINLPANRLLDSLIPLFHLLRELKYPLVFKFFLPIELLDSIQQYLRPAALPSDINLIIIKWNEQWQTELLRQRLRAATFPKGPRYTSIDQLAVPGLDLSAKLIAASRGSPRKLLQLVNRLFTIHAERSPRQAQALLTTEDWEQLQREMEEQKS